MPTPASQPPNGADWLSALDPSRCPPPPPPPPTTSSDAIVSLLDVYRVAKHHPALHDNPIDQEPA